MSPPPPPPKKMISLFLFSFAMALTFATLNTGGCSEELKNLTLRTYVDFTLHNPDVVLLQETYNLTENSSCWEHWPYHVHCAQGDSRGTGVTTLIKKNCDFNIITCSTIFNNYILYILKSSLIPPSITSIISSFLRKSSFRVYPFFSCSLYGTQ